jgi:hypothetical protein
MLTTLISTLTTPLRTIFSTGEIPCAYCRMLLSSLEEERRLNRELLGLSLPMQPTSPQPLSVISPPPVPQELPDVLDGLTPEMQEVLTREYAEEMSKHPKNLSVNPQVPQIIPGQVNLSQ